MASLTSFGRLLRRRGAEEKGATDADSLNAEFNAGHNSGGGKDRQDRDRRGNQPKPPEKLEFGKDYVVPGDPIHEETNLRTALVFAGFGVSAPELGFDDYAGADVHGCVMRGRQSNQRPPYRKFRKAFADFTGLLNRNLRQADRQLLSDGLGRVRLLNKARRVLSLEKRHRLSFAEATRHEDLQGGPDSPELV